MLYMYTVERNWVTVQACKVFTGSFNMLCNDAFIERCIVWHGTCMCMAYSWYVLMTADLKTQTHTRQSSLDSLHMCRLSNKKQVYFEGRGRGQRNRTANKDARAERLSHKLTGETVDRQVKI